MRLWSVHPRYLDAKGLVALWREGLLAQKVLAGKTKGYKNHPQLDRFKKTKNPLDSIGAYLVHVHREAQRRHYVFDQTKILKTKAAGRLRLSVTRGQLKHETEHLLKKLQQRDPTIFRKLSHRKVLQPHPCFKTVPGPIEAWEKAPGLY